jgi:membrane peptidoglycan carboxypeptidase
MKGTLLAVSLLWGVAIGGIWPQIIDIRAETQIMADSHTTHKVAHPGWSFPARVWSGSASLELPQPRLMEHARLRDYVLSCPPASPGEYCPKSGSVIPRGGNFPEGAQPAGLAGWTRPLALEPILIGYLMGADGEVRAHLPLDQAPDHLIDAIFAAEDNNFRTHAGVDLISTFRAAWANMSQGGFRQGGSTLTMQSVRMMTQRREKTMVRKLREMAMAVSLDGHLGKEGVLQMYLDGPYLGQSGNKSICGFQAAAQHYWGKDAVDLTLAEAATLAAILPAPGRYGPDVAPKQARLRRDRVLRKMKERGYNVTKARAEPMQVSVQDLPASKYPPYLQATRSWLEDHLPHEVVYGAGLEVYTALDLVAQTQTEQVLSKRLSFIEERAGRRGDDPLQAAGALLDPLTGAMVAAYGGTQESSTDFNRATQARRQAGSAFKPLVYALALSRMDGNGLPLYKTSDTVNNQLRTFEGTDGWRPKNSSGLYSESRALAYALPWSENAATASLLEELGGPRYLVDFAGRLGFKTRWLPEEMGLSLGQGEVTPVEMATFAATIINGGRRATGSPVHSARDAAGQIRVGAIAPDRPVMTPEAAALTRELMVGVVEFGTGNPIRGVAGIHGYKGPAMGKTGTTDRELDLWFVGGTPYYAAAVWVGYDKPTRIGGSASDFAAPLWGWWMRAVHEHLPEKDFEGPVVEHHRICPTTGLLPKPGCLSVRAPFLPGTAPEEISSVCATAPPKPMLTNAWRKPAPRAAGPGPGAPIRTTGPVITGPQITGGNKGPGPEPM